MSGQTAGYWGEQLDGAPSEGERSESASPEDNADLLLQIQDWYRADRDHWHDWRKETQLAYEIAAGHQWSEEDRQKLQEALRPVITFNRIDPFLDGVSGMEIANRQETRFIPRTLGASGVNELLTAAGKWCRDECDAEDEESDAFLDMIICGIGWTQTTLSYDDDPQGMALIVRVDPLEVLPDCNSRRKNFADGRRVTRIKDIPVEDARDLFPDNSDWELDAEWARDTEGEASDPHNRREAPYYINDQSGQIDKQRQMVRMVEIEWWEFEKGFTIHDPATGQKRNVSREEHTTLQSRAKQLNKINPAFPRSYQSVPFRRKKFHRAVVGGVILLEDDGPEHGGFTLKAMTAKRDRKHGTYYGLVRAMVDPQQWANKWLSQVLHIINSNAKGGAIAESDAFENPHEAMDLWADPQSLILARQINGPNGPKIMPKPQVAYPQGIDRLMQFAVDSIPATTGISPEMMAQVDRNQPGVLEMQRKQQGMAILAWAFNSLRRYRKEQGRLLLWLIQTFISDGRLIRIGGSEDAKYVPLVRDQQLAEYDVIVDDTPSSPNMKERVWGALTQLLPVLGKLPLPPTVWLKMMEYSPLPSTLIAEVNKDMQQQQQQQQGNPAMQAQVQLDQAKAKHLAAQTQHEQAKAMQVGALAAGDGQYKQAQIENLRASAAANLSKAHLDQLNSQFQNMMAAVNALLDVHGAANPPPPPSGPNGPVPQPAG